MIGTFLRGQDLELQSAWRGVGHILLEETVALKSSVGHSGGFLFGHFCSGAPIPGARIDLRP
jgi:hypothetical protein